MITTERWHHGSDGFGVSIRLGFIHLHGFGWSWELEWGKSAIGAGWVRRMRQLREK